MCFSANASFTAAGVLTAVGAAAVRENKGWRGLPYALIPFLFGVQQLIEGLQWISVRPGLWSQVFGYGFLFFAIFLWPVYVPLSVYLIEPQEDKKQRLGWFVALGAIIGLYSLIYLILNPITIDAAACCHIHYGFVMPFAQAVGACYVIATCGSLFFSSYGWVKTMSVVIFLALLVAFWYARTTYVSVWCYFAAVMSVMVLIHVRSLRNKKWYNEKRTV